MMNGGTSSLWVVLFIKMTTTTAMMKPMTYIPMVNKSAFQPKDKATEAETAAVSAQIRFETGLQAAKHRRCCAGDEGLSSDFACQGGGADRNLDTLTSKNDYAKRSFIF